MRRVRSMLPNALALVLGAGCGRIHFDPLGSTSGRDGSVGGDGNQLTCTPTTEICNGIDDDCNGIIDEGCPCTPFDFGMPVTNSNPPMVWTGTSFLFTLEDATNENLVVLSPGGLLGPQAVLVPIATYDGGFTQRAIAWSGTTAAVVWSTVAGHVELALFDAQATRLGGTTDVSTTGSAHRVAVVWAGDHFAVMWFDNGTGGAVLYLREYDASGIPRGPAIPTAAPGSLDDLEAAPTGYLADTAMTSGGLTLIGRDGSALAQPAPVIGIANLARGATNLAALYSMTSQLYVQIIDNDGGTPGTPVALPTYNGSLIALGSISRAASGSGYVIHGWTVSRDVVHLDVDSTGAIIGAPRPVTTSTASGAFPYRSVLTDHREALSIPEGFPFAFRLVQRCP